MQVLRFPCPSCAAELRIRDEDLIGRPFACPDCRQLLLLSRGETGDVLVERADQPTATVKRTAKTPAAASVNIRSPKTEKPARKNFIAKGKEWLASGGLRNLSPTTTTWVAAASVGAAVLVFLAMGIGLWLRSTPSDRSSAKSIADDVMSDAGQKTPARKPSEPTKKTPIAVAAIAPVRPAKKAPAPQPGEQKSITVIRPLTSPEKGRIPGDPTKVVESSGSTALPAAKVSELPKPIPDRQPAVAARPLAKPPAAKPKVEIAAGLRQRIVRFEQLKPVPLRDLIEILEEMLSVPIRGDKSEIADLDLLLQTPVTFDFPNTTVGDVLKSILAKAKLRYEVEPDEIRLRKLAEPQAQSRLP